jgi:hypothetical protein
VGLFNPALGGEDQPGVPRNGSSGEAEDEHGGAVESQTEPGSPGGQPPVAVEQPRILTDRRLRVWGIGLAAAFWLPAFGAAALQFWDFAAFYSAGALVGRSNLSQLAPVVAYQVERGLQPTPFVNPPAYALLYAPLAHLPYDVAGYLALAIMAALLLVAVEYGRRPFGVPQRVAFIGALAWPPAAAGVVSGQSSALALSLVVVVMAGLGRSSTRGSVLAGLAVGAMAYKPQLAAALLVLLLVRGDWRALMASMAGVGALYLGSVAATGGNWGWPSDWLATIQTYVGPDVAENGWQAISLAGLGGRLGVPVLPYLVGGLLFIYMLPQLRSRPVYEAVALVCALGLVASPHAWVYEATLLLPALAMLRSNRRAIVATYLLAAAWPACALLGWQPLALAVAVAPLLLVRSGHSHNSAGIWPDRRGRSTESAAGRQSPTPELQ